MEAGSESRVRSTLAVFGTAFRNRSLLLVELAWLAFNSAEWGVWLTLMVWAYTYGGAAAASLIVIVQLVPSIFISPYLGAITDRARAGRVLFIGLLIMGVSMAGLAAAMALDAPPVLIYILAPIMNLALSVPRPAQAALLPGVVRTPDRAHRCQRRLQLDGERQRAHRAGAHRRAARRRRPGAGHRGPRRLHAGRRLPSRRHPRAQTHGRAQRGRLADGGGALERRRRLARARRAHSGRRGRLAVHPRRRARCALRRARDHHPWHGRVRRRLPERGVRRRRGHRRRGHRSAGRPPPPGAGADRRHRHGGARSWPTGPLPHRGRGLRAARRRRRRPFGLRRHRAHPAAARRRRPTCSARCSPCSSR